MPLSLEAPNLAHELWARSCCRESRSVSQALLTAGESGAQRQVGALPELPTLASAKNLSFTYDVMEESNPHAAWNVRLLAQGRKLLKFGQEI